MLRSIHIILIIGLKLSICAAVSGSASANELNIIPQPNVIEQGVGAFIIKPTSKIVVTDKEALPVAQFFEHFINPATGLSLPIQHQEKGVLQPNTIYFNLDPNMSNIEGYTLKVTPQNIEITASAAQGLFYGVQTIRQLLPSEVEYQYPINNIIWSVPSVMIKDQPRFEYRGMHLDVGRHFYPVSFIKKYIDLIALHKMNRFHWHLTEDQGWRIEIKKHPKLTTVGAYRDSTVIAHPYNDGVREDKVRYGGYYSQAEIKDIVAYANQRFVTIIPEIDLPGHTVAALASYPELGCTDTDFKVRTRWGVSKDILCPSEQTFAFVEDVLNEVMDLFPSEYIHIGGDEAPKDRWKSSELAQQVIQENNLADEYELQSYFIKRLEKMLNKRGRKLIGWDEIVEGGLSETATVMYWRSWGQHKENIKHVLENGNPVIMTPVSHLYFDYYQSESLDEPLAWGAYLPLKRIYSYDPVFEGVTDQQAHQIKGAQGNVWTEYIKTPRQVEYQTQPRMAAVGELTWSARKDKNWTSFIGRLSAHYDRLTALGVNASTSVYNVHGELNDRQDVLTLETDGGNHEIRYTLDGTKPNNSSALYTQPFNLDKTLNIRAISVNKATGQQYGDYTFSFIKHLGLHKPVVFSGDTPKKQHAKGQDILTDGLIAHNRHHMRVNGKWFGTKNANLVATVDLETIQTVSKVSFGFQPKKGIRMEAPAFTQIELSTDGKNWQMATSLDTEGASRSGRSKIELPFTPTKARYARIKAQKAYRLDELIIE